MLTTIGEAVDALCSAVNHGTVDWEKLDDVLSEIEDINMIDLEDEETILSCFIGAGSFYHRGAHIPKIIQMFIDHGYDVKANDNKNGDYPLCQICWACYDRYILDAAKLLLNAGAKVIAPTGDEEDDDEVEGIVGAINWKLPGAWVVDKDYSWANNLEALYNLVQYAIDGKDFNSVRSFEECIGSKLSAVYSIKDRFNFNPNGVSGFADHLIFLFDDKPLVMRNYIDFSINPIFTEEHSDELCDVSQQFNGLLGMTLNEIVFIDQRTCSFEFGNDLRILFSSYSKDAKTTIGNLEIRQDVAPSLEKLYNSKLCCQSMKGYSKEVTVYDEEAIIAIGENSSVVFFSYPNGKYRQKEIKAISCSKEFFSPYLRRIPLNNPKEIAPYSQNGKTVALRIQYDSEYLYIKATREEELEIKLSEDKFNPCDCESLHSKSGKRFEFVI